jgi:tRNA(Ile)-lysidine synthase
MKETIVIERVLKTITRYSMLRRGSHVSVAVSGGPDSVCLLAVLRELAPRLELTLSVAHFNHRLRGAASDEDERFVADMAARYSLRFYRSSANVAQVKDNLEQAARRARRMFFAELIRQGYVDSIALGHTQDDQAETVLFRLMRGSGLAGLAGIYPVTADGFIRPLIEITRAKVERFLAEQNIEWREDSTNRDPRFARNRIRHSLLPQLQREWNPRIAPTLAHLADLAHEEERFWHAEIDRLAGDYFRARCGGIELPAERLASLPRAVARRLVRRAFTQVKGDLRRIEYAHVEHVLELASRHLGEGRLRLPSLLVTRSFDWIRIAPAGSEPAFSPVKLMIPGTYAAPDAASELQFKIARKSDADACATLKAELSLSLIPEPLKLRGWRPGDHYRPVGQSRDQKLQEMFQRARVPSWRRQLWPIVTGGEKIIWARGFGPAAEFVAQGHRGRILQVREIGTEAVESFSRVFSS